MAESFSARYSTSAKTFSFFPPYHSFFPLSLSFSLIFNLTCLLPRLSLIKKRTRWLKLSLLVIQSLPRPSQYFVSSFTIRFNLLVLHCTLHTFFLSFSRLFIHSYFSPFVLLSLNSFSSSLILLLSFLLASYLLFILLSFHSISSSFILPFLHYFISLFILLLIHSSFKISSFGLINFCLNSIFF
jgi:hypothetical protein